MAVISVRRDDLDEGEKITIPQGRWLAVITGNSFSDGRAHIRYRLLDGPDKAFIGSSGVQTFPLDGGNERKMIIPFITRMGLRERGSPTEDLGDFDLDEVNGREVIFDVEQQEILRKRGGTYVVSQWNCNNVWAADDPRAGDLSRPRKPSNGVYRPAPNPLAGVVSGAAASDDDDF